MIQQLISNIVLQLTTEDSEVTPSFIHGWKGWNNLKADKITDTVIILLEPVTSNDKLLGNYIEETYPIMLAFLQKSQLDYNPDQELIITDRMRRLRARFIYLASQSIQFKYVTDIITSDEFKVKDAALSGVGLQIKLTPMNGIPGC